MNLRVRIRLAVFVVRSAGLAIAACAWTETNALAALLLAVTWLVASGPLLRQYILPRLFPETVCPGCFRRLPLIARWKCGDHYIDHRERHILRFHCNQGHRLESFDCPRCRATILIQTGDRRLLRHGSAIRMRAVSRLPARGLLIGTSARGREVRVPWSVLAWHLAIFGGTGRGKSTLLANLILQLVEQRIGFSVLDCGDLARTVYQLVPPDRRRDVIFLDVADRNNPFPLNVLSAATPLEQVTLAEEILDVFRRMYGSSWGPSLEHQLRMGLLAAISAQGSLGDVYDLFTKPSERMRILSRVGDGPARAFWVNEFPAIPAIRRAAVVNKLAPIVFHPILGRIIAARDCALNADEIIANQRMLIASLWTGSPADDVTGLLGTFLVQKMIAAAFRQGSLAESQRVPHVLLVDEFPRFVNHRATFFDQILSEARRYKLSLVVASQYVDQLESSMRAAIFGNVGALLAFRLGPKDARLLTDEFTSSSLEDFTELPVGRCLARIGTDWNVVQTPPPPQRPPVVPLPPMQDVQRPPADIQASAPQSPADEDEFVQ